MYAEAQKLHIIENLLKVDNVAVLTKIELLLAGESTEPIKKKDFTEFVGMLTLEEINDLERIIEEGCEQINDEDWK